MKKTIYCLTLLTTICLLAACTNKNRSERTNTISSPTIEDSIAVEKPIVNVFIENSGSMDGYVKGVTEFEQAIYNYLSDIKIAKITDSLNLHYINSEIIPQGTVCGEMAVLKDFIEKLEPNSFRMKGGQRGTSDLAEVLKSVLKQTDERTISILITDGIFSPGKGKNAVEYLVSQQIGIKTSFSAFLDKEKEAAVIVYQLSSMFDGIYYNKIDAKTTIKEQRPFYIWIIGKTKHLVDLRRAVPENKFNGSGVQHLFAISSGGQEIEYALHPSIGKFRKAKKDTHTTIEKLEKDSRTGKVRFAVNANLSKLLLDDSYLLDVANYENNSAYGLEIKATMAPNGYYSHTLYFTSDRVQKGTLVVKLKVKRPDWIDGINDDEGETAVAGKTYGIKNQIDGVFDAFTFNTKNNYYAEIIINII